MTALANADATKGLRPLEYLGTLVLLIVGGNDTTRNSISGGVLALNENPAEYEKLRATWTDPEHGQRDHPLADAAGLHAPHGDARHRARRKADQAGRPVVMWYVSGNRDEIRHRARRTSS